MIVRPGKMIREVLGTIFKKPATIKYPFGKSSLPEGFRGEIIFHADKCVGCKLCMKDCPTGAINIIAVGEKKFEAEIDLGKCIYCAQCVDSCPKKALEVTGKFELAQLDRAKLKVVFHGEPEKNTQDKA